MIARGETLSADFLRERLDAAMRWRETVAPGRRGLPPRARRGRRPALAGGRPLRRLPRACRRCPRPRSALKDRDRGAARGAARSRAGILERNDPRVRELEGLEQRVGLLHGEVPDVGRGGGAACASRRTCGRARRPASSSTSARTTPWPATTRAGGCSTPSPTTAASRCRSPPRAAEVLAVDVSAEALARVRANAERNGIDQRHRARGQRLRPAARAATTRASASTP